MIGIDAEERGEGRLPVAILPPLSKKKGLRFHVTPCFIWAGVLVIGGGGG